MLNHRDWLAGFKGLTILRRIGHQMLHVALLARLRGGSFQRRRVCSRFVPLLCDVLRSLGSVVRNETTLEVAIEMRSVDGGSNSVRVLLYVLSVDLLQHVNYKG